ncbi:MAG: SulP family inorganic anion transporter [Aureispira sp.]|nr:SulP family inorganic anion transporter [Aureispira sp.]
MRNILKFDFSNLRGDFFGGLTAGIVALPLALAFGAQTELGAMAGLYGAIAIGILAALFGGTPTQISGPTAPMTVVSALVIADAVQHMGATSAYDPEVFAVIIATFFLAGFLEMLLGFFQIGKYIKYIPYPVVSGFMSGIGVIIVITQLFPMMGYNAANDAELAQQFKLQAEEVILEHILKEEAEEGILVLENLQATEDRAHEITEERIMSEAATLAKSDARGVVGTFKYFGRAIQFINWWNVLLGLITIFIVYGFKMITKAVPSSLVALVVVTLGAYFLLEPGMVDVIGAVESGLPEIHIGFFSSFLDLGRLTLMFEFAITLAALGAIDSLLTSVVADNITKTKHDSNQELIGQGIGNMGAAMLGGLPGAGATMRTVINANSGGKTKISGVFAGLFLLIVLLGLGGVVAYIPKGVLAGILITVGIGIIDYKAFRHLKSVPKSDVFIMFTVLGLTVFVDLLVAVGIGMVLAAMSFMKKISDVVEHNSYSDELTEFSPEMPWDDEGDIIERIGDRVYIKHLIGPLFFGFASRFQDMVKALPSIEVVVIRMGRVPYIDQSGQYALEDAIMELQTKDIKVVFVGLHGQPLDMVRNINLVPGLVPEDHTFKNFEDCTVWLQETMKDLSLDTNKGATDNDLNANL